MNINKHNYEAFFLDYHEGTLTPQQVADLLLFVEQHPELKAELEAFENLTLEDLDAVTFEGKSSLKKAITIENLEDYFIGSVEETLTPSEKQVLDQYIKQHPQFLPELELFQKTKLSPELDVFFADKAALKKATVTADELLVASVEGLLSPKETELLHQQLSVDAQMKHTYGLFKQTKLKADMSVIYEDKEELKRKERKIVPFFYYVAAAASIALLIGLFFIFNNGKNEESNFADKTKATKTAPVENKLNNNEVIPSKPEFVKELSTPEQTAIIVKNKKAKTSPEKKEITPVIVNEKPENTFAENKKENQIESPENQIVVRNETPKINSADPNTRVSLSVVEGQAMGSSSEFLSIKQIMAEKIKEKTLDEKSLAAQKRSGRIRRFSGWDLAQIVTKGISKLTGRDVEVKPTYNEEGDVTAYALGNGVQISRGK